MEQCWNIECKSRNDFYRGCCEKNLRKSNCDNFYPFNGKTEPVADVPCNVGLCATWAAEINVTLDGERYWAETAWGRKEAGDTPHEAIVNLIERNSFYYGVTIHHKYGA